VSRDLRQYAKQTETRLIIGFLLLVFFVGDGLIFYFYGPGAGLMGLACLAGVLVPALLVVFFLWIAEKVVKLNE
jgi:membrane protein YdbS with pleckstrin-like domain